MRRRPLLAALGGLAVPGCIRVGRLEDFPIFERRLRETSLRLRRVASDARRWVVEYYPADGEAAFREEVATVATIYADTVPTGAERRMHRLLECLLLDAGGDRTGTYTVAAEWAREHAAGSLDAEEYVRRVLSTVER